MSLLTSIQFLCHYYNLYFAHTAGGRMIGKSVSNALLDGKELEFYKYYDENGNADVNMLLERVRENINVIAEVSL